MVYLNTYSCLKMISARHPPPLCMRTSIHMLSNFFLPSTDTHNPRRTGGPRPWTWAAGDYPTFWGPGGCPELHAPVEDLSRLKGAVALQVRAQVRGRTI